MKNISIVLVTLNMMLLSVAAQKKQSSYKSQFGQDRYVNSHFFASKKGGVFVDIGAHDGVRFSNSYFFEKECDWQGLCIEPMPEVFSMLTRARSCACVNCCIAPQEGVKKFMQVVMPGLFSGLSGLIENYDAQHKQRIKELVKKTGGYTKIIDVQCYPLMSLLDKHNITHIDFLSIDTEGGEFDILQSIDFEKIYIDVITVENNYKDTRLRELLTKKGFVFQTKLVCDEIYRNSLSIMKSSC